MEQQKRKLGLMVCFLARAGVTDIFSLTSEPLFTSYVRDPLASFDRCRNVASLIKNVK